MDKELIDKLQELLDSDPEAKEKVLELIDQQENGQPVGIGNKIKYLLKATKHQQKELIDLLGMSGKQATSRKFAMNSFDVQELIKIVEFLGGQIIVKVDDIEMEFNCRDL